MRTLLFPTSPLKSTALPVPESNPVGTMQTETNVASALKGGKDRLVVDCDTNIINEVSIEPTWLHSLVHVGTLGLISPLEISYQCGKPLPPVVDFDEE